MREHEYLTRLEAADVLRTSDQTVDRRIKEGVLEAVRVGRRVLVTRRSVESYLARCRDGTSSAAGGTPRDS